MIEQIYTYLTIEAIYLWLNIGVLPFWFILIFFPNSSICKIFITSIFPFIIFSFFYAYLLFEIFKSEYNFLNNFNLYLGFNSLLDLFSNKNFVILFWIHFLSINLFCGGWMVSDSRNFNISKYLIILPLIVTYLIGPLGLFFYWILRIFFAKRISIYN